MSSERSWGITPPVSTALPTPAETQASNALLEELKRQGTFESAEETNTRKKVLADIQRIVDELVRRIAKEKYPRNPTLIRDARGEVFTYGSFCLGVYGPGSDIDTLVVAPKYVTRQDYFEHLPKMLEEMAPKGAVTDLTPVEDAFVPIIKFEYWGISIDLIFSRIATLDQFPPHGQLKLSDNSYLRGLDDAELRSVNGTRVTNEILNLVPEQSTFRLALRAIKLWAQRRAIYANIVGFPGGVVWAMLVARVCQLYPRATSATIVAKFFHLIRQWPWPQPVMLKAMEEGPLNVRVWNPKVYRGDSFHLMPVITPAYPEMCSTFNITHSNKEVIQRELLRAGQIAGQIMAGKQPWKDLFVKHSFFTQGYKYYLAIISTSKEDEAHKIWSGYIESKVRILVASLEKHHSIAIAHPFNKGFERRHRVQNAQQFEAVMDGSMSFIVKEDEKKDEAPVQSETNGVKAEGEEPANSNGQAVPSAEPDSANPNVKAEPEDSKTGELKDVPTSNLLVYTTTHYIGLELAEGRFASYTAPYIVDLQNEISIVFFGKVTNLTGAKSLDLSYQVNEFKDTCFGWDKYKDKPLSKLSSLSVQHVKSINLPDDVFEPGEVKPTRQPKKPGALANGAQRKRPAPNDGSLPPPKRPQSTNPASLAAAT
ncbi:Poly(A) polymerase pla1 [Apiospora rasikravindrae]|uniref:Poly(A) polymerase n=1 Tax=Apiospora rasikravindrae TaxID=990691 RepID=A0ABR1SLP4_9PEZI